MGSFDRSPSVAALKDLVRSKLLEPDAPPHLASRFLHLDAKGMAALEATLRENFFFREPADFLQTEAGRLGLEAHLLGRLDADRRWCIPWLNAARQLQGARVLEIGCGTGATTIALAEQGADVVAIDVDEPALRAARRRLELYGLEAELHLKSATEIEETFAGRQFDFIIYWASLEHMTHAERMATMQQSWRMLAKGAMWVVIETPNRLHLYDSHTSFLPFFHWLSDDVALAYAKFSARSEYRDAMQGLDLESPGDREQLARWGRGMSYHEFELTMGPVAGLKVINSMRGYHASVNVARRASETLSRDARWAALLRREKPDAHAAFFESYLNLIIEKT